jgi:hypothetical protein
MGEVFNFSVPDLALCGKMVPTFLPYFPLIGGIVLFLLPYSPFLVGIVLFLFPIFRSIFLFPLLPYAHLKSS